MVNGSSEAKRWRVYSAVRALQPQAAAVEIHRRLNPILSLADVPLAEVFLRLEQLEDEGYVASEMRPDPRRPKGRRFWCTTGKFLLAPDNSAAAPTGEIEASVA